MTAANETVNREDPKPRRDEYVDENVSIRRRVTMQWQPKKMDGVECDGMGGCNSFVRQCKSEINDGGLIFGEHLCWDDHSKGDDTFPRR